MGEGGAVVGGDAEDDGGVRGATVARGYVELRESDDGAVLDDVPGDGRGGNDGGRVRAFKASNLGADGGLVAVYCVEDLLTSEGVGGRDGEVQRVGGTVVAGEAKILASAEV